MELRILQIIDDDDDDESSNRPEVHFIGLLLDYFMQETSCRNNFEFIQAMIRLFLKVRFHPCSIMNIIIYQYTVPFKYQH